MTYPQSLKRWWLLAVVMFLAACSGELNTPPGDSKVTLSLGNDELKVVDWKKALNVDEEPADDVHDGHEGHDHEHSSMMIDYVFYPEDGSPQVEGHVPDPRVLRNEFDENGEPDPLEVVAGNGVLEVRVPSVRGEIHLYAGEMLLGKADFDPKGAKTAQSALLRDGDILGSPVAVVAHGQRSEKVDILFVPEGYNSNEMRNFHQHVDTIVSQLQRKPVYKDVWSGINIWRQDIRSRDRGTGSGARPRQTAFETASGISGVERCIFFANNAGQRAARQVGDRAGAEVVVVLVNSTQHGGCAGDNLIVTARPRHVTDTVAHELGHALFDLADEYTTPRPGGYCSTGPNVSSSPRSLPWADMVNTSQLPTPNSAQFGTIGAFEGAGYCSRGRYRPTHRCMMRSLNDNFCAVCKREVFRKMSRYMESSPTNPSTGSGTNTGTNTGSTSTNTNAPDRPHSLTPNGQQVASTSVKLDWRTVSGATRYELSVGKLQNGSYREFVSFERIRSEAEIRIQETGGTYQWRVRACNSAGCSVTVAANFTYGSTGTNTGSTGTNTGSTGSNTGSTSTRAPGIPSGLSPQTSSVTSDGTPSMSWNAVSGAANYRFKMIEHDGSRWTTYVQPQTVDATRVRTTLRTPERWYGFAVQACNSAGCSQWTEFSTMYYRP